MVDLHVLHQSPAHADPRPALRAIAEREPAVVFAAFSGRRAADFILAHHEAGLGGGVPVVGSSFLVADRLDQGSAVATRGLLTAKPWPAPAADALDGRFQSAYATATGRQPSMFALLGFELAQCLSAALRTTGGDVEDGAALCAALSHVRIAGPRGEIVMQPTTRTTLGPRWLTEARWEGGAPRAVAIASLPTISELDERVDPLRTGVRSGWLDPYLCA